MKTFEMRPLYRVDEIMKEAGYEITHVYDDLVFMNHSKILVQFSSINEAELILHIHKSCEPDEQKKLFTEINIIGERFGSSVVKGQLFELNAVAESEQVTIQFYNL
jgi:hypothetical protein